MSDSLKNVAAALFRAGTGASKAGSEFDHSRGARRQGSHPVEPLREDGGPDHRFYWPSNGTAVLEGVE